ncbi:hypothetical protein HGM15179_002340, partial [Zosterops borbonicus]
KNAQGCWVPHSLLLAVRFACPARSLLQNGLALESQHYLTIHLFWHRILQGLQ